MIESVILALIYICLICLAVYLIIWVLQSVVGIALPEKVIQIIWVVVILVVILVLLRAVLPGLGIKLVGLLPMLA